jgi:hypothetical protein
MRDYKNLKSMAYMNEYDDLMATFPQGEFTEEM